MPDQLQQYERKFRRIARQISPLEIQSLYEHEDMSWDDLFLGNKPAQGSGLFLGKFSQAGIELVMDRFGFYRRARNRGLRDIQVAMDTSDPFQHILRIYNGDPHGATNLVMEFVARYQTLRPSGEPVELSFPDTLNVLKIEWLTLQNPTRSFTSRRPRLPGQEFPGLGMGDAIMALFTLMGRYLKIDGFINVPEHFHTAIMFSRRYTFLNIQQEARMRALSRDLWQKYRLSVIAWAAELGAISERNSGELLVWEPHKQIMPLKRSLRAYFSGTEFKATIEAECQKLSYRLDEEKLREALTAMDNPPLAV